MSRAVAVAREAMRRLRSPAPALFAAIGDAERLSVLTGEVPLADSSPFGDFSFSSQASAGGAGDRKPRAVMPAAPRREARQPVAPETATVTRSTTASPVGQSGLTSDAGSPVFSFRKRMGPAGIASQRTALARSGDQPIGRRETDDASAEEAGWKGSGERAESEMRESDHFVVPTHSAAFWAELAARSADALLAPAAQPPEQAVFASQPTSPTEPEPAPASLVASVSESDMTMSVIDRVASAILSGAAKASETRIESTSPDVRFGVRELREIVRMAAVDPPALTARPSAPPALEAEEIAELVNDVLAEQARRHGVDLS